MKRTSIAIRALFAIVFLAEIYLFAATASVYDDYQPGISAFRIVFNPLLLLLIVAGSPLVLAAMWRRNRMALYEFARSTSLALVICLISFASIIAIDRAELSCDQAAPVRRELYRTLRHSLACPDFSGRSDAVAFFGGTLSALLWAASRRRVRRIQEANPS